MKKFLFLAALFFSAMAFSQTVMDYSGNGKNGFGGAVGQGTLTIEEQPDSVIFSLTRGPGRFDSILVFYIDVPGAVNIPLGVAAPISTTSGLTGSSTDPYRAAVAGHNPSTGRAILNFPEDFQPDGAIALDKSRGKVFVFGSGLVFSGGMLEGGSFAVVPSGTDSATFTLRSSKEKLGYSGNKNFKFIATYIGMSASRSNEAFGDSFNTYARPAGTVSYNSYTITSYFNFISGALPVKLMDFKAAKDGNTVNIHWQITEETNIDKYEVQRSTDGVSFTTIASVKAKNSVLSSSYSIKDLSAQSGINYYRLVITERGRSEISRIVSLNIEPSKKSFAASCLSSRMLKLTLNGISAGTYKLGVLNYNGQLMQAENLKAEGAFQTMQIPLKQNLAKGFYSVILQSANAKYSANILVE